MTMGWCLLPCYNSFWPRTQMRKSVSDGAGHDTYCVPIIMDDQSTDLGGMMGRGDRDDVDLVNSILPY